MTTYICLLRGINILGRKRVRMDALKAMCVALELRDATTYLQSGNVIFRSDERIAAPRIESAVRTTFGFEVKVVLRTLAELRKIVAATPFGAEHDPSRVLVAFLSAPLPAAAEAALHRAAVPPEEIHVAGREIHIHFANGVARSKLNTVLTDKRLGVTVTARNWRTVTALLALGETLGKARTR